MPVYYANPNPLFQPAMRLIASISNSNPGIVTTTFAHQYQTGTIVRLTFAAIDGMPEVNGKTYTITYTGPTTFTIPIDTTFFQPFNIPVVTDPNINTAAMVVPVGEDNSILYAATQNILL